MKLTNILFVIITIVVLFEAVIINRKNKDSIHFETAWLRSIDNKEFSQQLLIENHIFCYYFDSIITNTDKFISFIDDSICLPMLVFRFQQTDCHACIDSVLTILQSFPKITNKLFVTDFDNSRQFAAFLRVNSIQHQAFSLPSNALLLEPDILNKPYLFVIDKNCNARNLFFPIIEIPNETKEYLKLVKVKFFQ